VPYTGRMRRSGCIPAEPYPPVRKEISASFRGFQTIPPNNNKTRLTFLIGAPGRGAIATTTRGLASQLYSTPEWVAEGADVRGDYWPFLHALRGADALEFQSGGGRPYRSSTPGYQL